MKADLGPLDKRARIERRTSAADPEYGTPIEAWELVAVVWCSVQDELPSKSAESVKNGIAVSAGKNRVRMRYRTDLDSSMRLIINRPSPTVYQIVAGPAELGQKDGTELFCERYSTDV